MKEPLVSIIVPVYNVEKYIKRCVESIINQSYSNLEIILINDGSKDNSGKICDEFKLKDKRINVIHKKNCGVSSARNEGLKHVRGDYITFVDSDDWIEKETIKTFINKLINKYNYDLIMYGFMRDSGKAYKQIELNDKVNIETYTNYNDLILEIETLIVTEKLNSLCNKIYKREIIDKIGVKFDENISIGEDLLFNLEYILNIRSMYITNKVYYHYMIREEPSLTKGYKKDKFNQLIAVNDAMKNKINKTMIKEELLNSLKYIRLKNITSCFIDLHKSDCNLTKNEKLEKINKILKNEKRNMKIDGDYKYLKKIKILSLIYTKGNSHLVYLLSYYMYIIKKNYERKL